MRWMRWGEARFPFLLDPPPPRAHSCHCCRVGRAALDHRVSRRVVGCSMPLGRLISWLGAKWSPGVLEPGWSLEPGLSHPAVYQAAFRRGSPRQGVEGVGGQDTWWHLADSSAPFPWLPPPLQPPPLPHPAPPPPPQRAWPSVPNRSHSPCLSPPLRAPRPRSGACLSPSSVFLVHVLLGEHSVHLFILGYALLLFLSHSSPIPCFPLRSCCFTFLVFHVSFSLSSALPSPPFSS